MRQLIQSYRSGEMKLEEVPAPVLRTGGVLVRTSRSVVSAGTEKMIVDLAQKSLLGKARARPDLVRKVIDTARKQGLRNAIQKAQSKLDSPIPLGYSSAGVVVGVGEGVSEYSVGDRVACGGAGYANHADFSFVPRNLTARIPDGIGFEEASFATVGAIALQGVRQAAPTLGESVGVLGLGLIGQLCVQLLRANGCRVFGFDPDSKRARLAEEMGAHCAVSDDPERAAERFSRARGPRCRHRGRFDSECRPTGTGGTPLANARSRRRCRPRGNGNSAIPLLPEGARSTYVHVVRPRTLRPRFRRTRLRLPLGARAMDGATQPRGVSGSRRGRKTPTVSSNLASLSHRSRTRRLLPHPGGPGVIPRNRSRLSHGGGRRPPTRVRDPDRPAPPRHRAHRRGTDRCRRFCGLGPSSES